MQNKYVVSVIVRAYNAEKTLNQALDSILAQKTKYPYQIVIGVNPSTDNTIEICRKYAKRFDIITLLAHDTNIGPVRNWICCINRCLGKYVMMCDSDDYWQNSSKIQLQVEYMESHPECVLCHSDNDIINGMYGKVLRNCKKGIQEKEGFVQKEIFNGTIAITNVTSCYRRDVFEQYVPLDKYVELGLLGDDYPTWVILSAYGRIHYLPVSTATYRVGNVSVTREPNYDKIRHRYETEKKQAKWLMEMFPNLGTYTEADDKYYDDYCSHQLLLAAYRSNDYASACKFAKQDKMPNWKTRMAHSWLTFQIARIYSIYKA